MIGNFFGGVHPSVIWGVLAILLALVEIVLPGVFMIWLAVAAALTATLVMLLPMGEALQLLAFAVFSVLAMSGGRLWYLARPVVGEDPLLNDRAARMIGRHVVVVEAIMHGRGRVRVDDGSWQASGPDAAEGSFVIVTGVSGSTLTVAPLPTAAPD